MNAQEPSKISIGMYVDGCNQAFQDGVKFGRSLAHDDTELLSEAELARVIREILQERLK